MNFSGVILVHVHCVRLEENNPVERKFISWAHISRGVQFDVSAIWANTSHENSETKALLGSARSGETRFITPK